MYLGKKNIRLFGCLLCGFDNKQKFKYKSSQLIRIVNHIKIVHKAIIVNQKDF